MRILRVKQFADQQRAQDFRAGPGASMRLTPYGRVLRANQQVVDFSHPWLGTLNGQQSIALLPGTINTKPATIYGVQLDGTQPDGSKGSIPSLTWDQPMLTADGIGYVCAEIQFDSTKGFVVSTVKIVQVANPDTEDGSDVPGITNAAGGAMPLQNYRARCPLIMLQRQAATGNLSEFQIVYFNLTARIAWKADGVTPDRIFFW